ncbi:NAD-dependent epimerase/dehydratase family protein [Hydromonas duriensis]|uniref:Dihydroflavonol-4-reductase n=1 Tax=Hydromonas duriensis TaxID=1527608 RepID=A0A4R6Y8R4_9BURK|nr:NAD-dependent epimerase/dehydratase family protein [Hydromonas duriensis]TDR31806.1 dihydroflavonol-4-reductase [Hydromonas duriensis]
MELVFDQNKPVLVTGATGYVAGWIIERLLTLGLTVHAAVRNPSDVKKIAHLDALAKKHAGNIRYFKADLLNNGDYDEAMKGCQVVFHTASPFVLNVQDPQKDLVDPAVLGTRNVLESVNRCPSVERVVLTSSCAAIYGDNIDVANTPNNILTEEIWNTSSSLQHNPYSYSKTLAEAEAWKMAEAQNHWRLVVINPSLVIGPGINPNATSESFNLVRQFGDGRAKMGVPKFYIGVVDVRDVADAHVRAAFLPNAQGRHILSGHDTNLAEMAACLLPKFGNSYPIPKRILPKWLVWLVGPLADKTFTREIIRRNVNIPWHADNSKSRRELGLIYRSLNDSMNEFFEQLVQSGQLNAKK